MCITAEREAVNAAERAERKQQLREKVSCRYVLLVIYVQALLSSFSTSVRGIVAEHISTSITRP